jgi:hypothetical protein
LPRARRFHPSIVCSLLSVLSLLNVRVAWIYSRPCICFYRVSPAWTALIKIQIVRPRQSARRWNTWPAYLPRSHLKFQPRAFNFRNLLISYLKLRHLLHVYSLYRHTHTVLVSLGNCRSCPASNTVTIVTSQNLFPISKLPSPYLRNVIGGYVSSVLRKLPICKFFHTHFLHNSKYWR